MIKHMLLVLVLAGTARVAAETCKPCEQAAKLEHRPWNFTKAAKLYRDACKRDESGPVEACRHAAILGVQHRGFAMSPEQAAASFERTCKRGDAPSCAWQRLVAAKFHLAPQDALALCKDRDTCEPAWTALGNAIGRTKGCDASWWQPVADACKRNEWGACIVYAKLAEQPASKCPRPSFAIPTTGELIDRIAAGCAAGDVDSCIETHHDTAFPEELCKAGDETSCG